MQKPHLTKSEFGMWAICCGSYAVEVGTFEIGRYIVWNFLDLGHVIGAYLYGQRQEVARRAAGEGPRADNGPN